MPTVQAGTRIADRFTILRFLAEGGMGEVYEARDEILEDAVALKFLSRRNLGDEGLLRRFRREIQLARKVTHPNVCRLYDVYEHPLPIFGSEVTVPVAFVSMELLRGETLEDRLERDGPLGEEDALAIVVQMCRALAAAHDAGIVHRDFKSNNVMLEERDGRTRVVVTDFGLARSVAPGDPSRTPLTLDQIILGTAEYMSPEQIQGLPVSPASDLYALGVVIFEMVTGNKPYQAPTPMQLLVQRVNEPPARPRDFAPHLSARWEEVILRCLEEAPEDRPASAGEVARALGADEPRDSAVWSSPPSSVRRSRRRKPARWAVAAALVVLGALSFWASRSGERAAPTGGVFAPTRLTTGLGLELDPAPSPDGERLAYVSELEDGTFALELVDLDGASPPRRLSLDDPLPFEPAWLDDRRLVYHSASRGGLFVVDLASTRTERLTEIGSRPAVSPDGRRLVFQTDSSPLLSDTTVPALPPSTLGLLEIGADGAPGELHSLTRANVPEGGHGAPAWSPDARHVVFAASRRSASEIWVVPVSAKGAAGEPSPIVRAPATAYDPVFAPDGRSIYFVARDQEVKGLWRVRVDPRTLAPRGEPAQVAGLGLSSIRQPRIVGGVLVYAAYLTRSNLYSLPLDPLSGSPAMPLVPVALTEGTDRHSRPAFSLDGARLAFDHWQLGVDIDVFVLDLNRGETLRATFSGGTNTHPSWLPDGRLLYTQKSGDGTSIVQTFDPRNPAHQRLFELDPGEDWAVASPDGRRVAYHSGAGEDGLDIWIRDLSGDHRPWRLTFHPGSAGFPAWSPDSEAVAYQVRVEGGSHLWVVPIDGGAPRPLVEAEGDSWPYGWSPDGRFIVFAGRRDGRWDLYRVTVEDGAVERLTDLGRRTGYVRYPAWSPLGDQIVFERAETLADLFVVRDFR